MIKGLKKFFPISRDIIKNDETYPFNIYEMEKDNIFVIVNNGGDIFKSINDSMLYIKSEDRSSYQELLNNHVHNIIRTGKISFQEKVNLVSGNAATAIETLFQEEITPQNIKNVLNITENLVDLMLRDNNVMASILNVSSHDYDTYTHSVDVALYAIAFGKFLGFKKDDLDALGKGALLHDIGKKRISTKIINKDGKLTDEEFDEMKKHPEFGVEILISAEVFDEKVLDAVLQHHEKCDGTGYPKGLHKDDISDYTKMIAICDIFAAMTTRRSYKSEMSSIEALSLMIHLMDGKLDETYLKSFIRLLKKTGKEIGVRT